MHTSKHEASLQAYCDRVWQAHERASRPSPPFYEEHFPILDDADYLYALLLIENAIAGSAEGAEHLEPRLFALVDEGEPEPESDAERRWRTEYEAELDEFWKLNESLTWSYGRAAAWAFKAAGLSESEQQVMRLALAGDDVETIAKALKRQRRTVQTFLDRARWKLADMPATTRLARARAEGSR